MSSPELFPVATGLATPLTLQTPPQPLPLTTHSQAMLGAESLMTEASPATPWEAGGISVMLPSELSSNRLLEPTVSLSTAPNIDPLSGVSRTDPLAAAPADLLTGQQEQVAGDLSLGSDDLLARSVGVAALASSAGTEPVPGSPVFLGGQSIGVFYKITVSGQGCNFYLGDPALGCGHPSNQTAPKSVVVTNPTLFGPITKIELVPAGPFMSQLAVISYGTLKHQTAVSFLNIFTGGLVTDSISWKVERADGLPDTGGNLLDPTRNPRNQQPAACSNPAAVTTNSETELQTGAVIETHDLVGYQSLGVERGISLRYNSFHADARPIVHFGYSQVGNQPGDQLLVGKLTVNRGGFTRQAAGYTGNQYGLTGGENFWAVPDAAEPQNLNAALQVDLRDQASGIYTYNVQRSIQNFNAASPNFFTGGSAQGSLYHVNRLNSAFGAGWSLEGWQEMVVNPDNSLLLIDGDGSLLEYKLQADGNYTNQLGDTSTVVKLADGTFRRTLKDQTVYQFNSRNQIASLTDRNGNQTQYLYDAAGNLTQMTDPVGLVTRFTYTGSRITSITDPANRITQMEYDAAGNLTKITDPDGAARTWTYDSQNHMTAEVDQRGNREQTVYDAFGRADYSIRKDGTVINLDPVQVQGLADPNLTRNFTTAPQVLALSNADLDKPRAGVTDALGNTVWTRLDRSGAAIESFDSVGSLGSVDRCACGRVNAMTDANGQNTITYSYDSKWNVIGVRDSLTGSQTQQLSYDPLFNQLTSSIDELGRQTLHSLDSRGNILSKTQVVGAVGDSDDLVTRMTYLSNGLVDTITDALGRVTDFDYDARGRLITTTTALGTPDQAIERYEYDNAGNMTAKVDANGNRTVYVYDARNRLTQLTEADPDGTGVLTSPITRYTYDAAGNLTTLRDARNNNTQFEYDSLHRQTRIIEADPDGTGVLTSPITQYSYDAEGNLLSSTDALGRVTRYEYDARDRLVRQFAPDPDGAGVLTAPVTTFAYDLNNNLVSQFNPNGFQTQWQFDPRNRLIAQLDPLGNTTQFGYDSANQRTRLTDARGNATTYAYDELGRLTQSTDALNQVTRFTYDAVGNRTGVIDPLGRTTTYEFDPRNRLVGLLDPLGQRTRYRYDSLGNLLSTTSPLGEITTNAYDALHRRISVTDPTGQTTRYTFDANNNLLSLTDPLGNRTSYTLYLGRVADRYT
jgi:YD repeat-containing protein